MELKNSHGGYAGKSLVEKMRDKADEAFKKYMEHDCDGQPAQCGEKSVGVPYGCGPYYQGLSEGYSEALALMCSTKEELQWNSMEARYEDRKRNATGG